MGQAHPSTADERIQWVRMMLAHQGDCGLMTRLSREARVSRRTLYVWRDHAEAALRTAVGPPTAAAPQPTNPRQLLTFWINHRTARGIQGAVQEFTAHGVSLATITAVLHEAGQRAIRLMQTQRPPRRRCAPWPWMRSPPTTAEGPM